MVLEAKPTTGEEVLLHTLVEPSVSSRESFPAKHVVTAGLSPWGLSIDTDLRATLSSLTWTIVSYGQSRPVGDGSVIATETPMVVDVTATRADGSGASMSDECMLRTELDDRSLADRQLTGQGWLLPIGYTVVVDTPII